MSLPPNENKQVEDKKMSQTQGHSLERSGAVIRHSTVLMTEQFHTDLPHDDSTGAEVKCKRCWRLRRLLR